MNAISQSANHLPVVGTATRQALEQFSRYPYLRLLRKSEIGRQHSDHRRCLVPNREFDRREIGRAAQFLPPISVTHQGNRGSAEAVILRQKAAPQHWPNPHERKKILG